MFKINHTAAAALGALALNVGPASADEESSIAFGGRLDMDISAIDADGLGDRSTTRGNLRRARLNVDVNHRAWRYFAEIDVSSGDDISVQNVIASRSFDEGRTTLMLGHQKPPASLDELTSSSDFDAMERAAFTDAFRFTRGTGIGLRRSDGTYTVSVAVLAGGAVGFQGVGADYDHSIAVRGTRVFERWGGLLHLGASALYRGYEEGRLRDYSVRPNSSNAPRFLDTPSFAESDVFFGLEAAFTRGPFHAAAEYGRLEADGPVADGGFQGAYVEAGYYLTGETRPYRRNQGRWGHVTPERSMDEGGPGAILLRGRLDWIELNDRPVSGGEQLSVSAGVNWRLNNHAYTLFEGVHSDIDGAPAGDGEVRTAQMRLVFHY